MSHTETTPKQAVLTQSQIDRAREIAHSVIKADTSLRPPRTDEERQNGFAAWMTKWRNKFLPEIQEAIHQAFSALDLNTRQVLIEQYAEPHLELWLRAVALRYHAGLWVSRNMGDATTMSLPEKVEEGWRVPLGVRGYGENLGEVILDGEGNVISDQTTTPEQIDQILDQITRVREIAKDIVRGDTSLRIPRTEAERENGFAAWIAQWRAKFEPELQAAIQREFPALVTNDVQTLAEQYAVPAMETLLRDYALRSRASAWAVQYLGDALIIGWPEWAEGNWRVPLGLRGYGGDIGQIVLDENGTVIPTLTSTKEALFEALHARTVPPAAAATG